MYELTAPVVTFFEKQGIPLSQVQIMVGKAARVTQGAFNRRYHSWLFLLRHREVYAVKNLDSGESSDIVTRGLPEPGPDEFLAIDDCPSCDGAGCEKCDWSGELPILRKITKHKFGPMT